MLPSLRSSEANLKVACPVVTEMSKKKETKQVRREVKEADGYAAQLHT